MPVRGYNPRSPFYRSHMIWRPDKIYTSGDGDPLLGGMTGNPKWKWMKTPSPWVRGKQGGYAKWREMRAQTGQTGHKATYKPLIVKPEVVEYSGTPAIDYLKLPEKKFFETYSADKGRLSREEQVFRALPAENRVESMEEWQAVPVRKVAPSNTTHLKQPPTSHTARYLGGLGHAAPNAFAEPVHPRARAQEATRPAANAHLRDLVDALATGAAAQPAAEGGTFALRPNTASAV